MIQRYGMIGSRFRVLGAHRRNRRPGRIRQLTRVSQLLLIGPLRAVWNI
jgi:hypothetical protein